MRKQSIKITTFIIILTIAMVYFQFFCYYFFDQPFIVIGITVFTALLLSHLSLELSLSYELGFLQSLFSVLISFAFLLLIYFHQPGNFLVYKRFLPLILLLNWLVPFCYYLIRCLYDRGPRFVGYRSYFIKTSLLFLAFYVLILADKIFLRPLTLPASVTLPEISLIPFLSTAAYIEAYIYNKAILGPLLLYIAKIILLYIPFGFYVRQFGKEMHFLLKVFLLCVFPLALEGAQYFWGFGRFEIDDFFFALLGGILGMILQMVIDRLFIHKTNYFFLKESRAAFTIFK